MQIDESKIIKHGVAVIQMHPTSQLVIESGTLVMNKGLPKGGVGDAQIILHENAKLIIKGDWEMFPNSSIEVHKGNTLTLGSGIMNKGSLIRCIVGMSIGYNVNIAAYCHIMDWDYHAVYDENGDCTNDRVKPTIVESNVWLCTHSVVQKGVHIGHDSVVAAGAVVTKDVPPNSMVGGVPAKVIRTGIYLRDPKKGQ